MDAAFEAWTAYGAGSRDTRIRDMTVPSDVDPSDSSLVTAGTADRDQTQEEVLSHLRFLGREMGAMSRAVSRSMGLHHTQLRALEQLLRREEVSPGDLSRTLGLSTGATTALVDNLEAMGHLRRVRRPGDRRRVVLEITDTAKRESESAFRPLGARFREMTDAYSEEELRVLDRFLGDLRDAIREYGAEVGRRPSTR